MEVGFNETLSVDVLTTHSTPWSENFVFDSLTQRLIVAIVACVVTVIGIPGNSIVILAVILSKKLQNKTNIFVVNLACADLLTCAVLPFQALSLLNETWPLSPSLCRAVAIFVGLGPGSSIVNLALIAFLRYSIITKSRSFTERLLTKVRVSLLVCGAWFIPFVFVCLPPAFGVGAVGYSHRYKICTADSSHPLSDIYTAGPLFVVLPCLVVIVLSYVKIYRFVRNAGYKLTQPRNRLTITEDLRSSRTATITSTEAAIFRRQVKVTQNMFVVVCTYIICVMPFGIATLKPLPTYPLIPWTLLLLFMNSCLNPIIYGIKHPQFKKVFRSILTCSWRNVSELSSFMTSGGNVSN